MASPTLRSFWLVFAAAVAVGAASARPQECRDLVPSMRGELVRRSAALEAKIAEALAAGRSEDDVREQLNAQVLLAYQLACLREDLQTDPFETRAPGDPTVRHVTVPVFYATNRRYKEGVALDAAFGDSDAETLLLGRAEVSIPTQREPGDLSVPSSWKFERSADPARHFVLRSLSPLAGRAAFEAAQRTQFPASGKKSLLLFVHGFRVTFEEAALRAAQLAHDLRFGGTVMFYSWPSTGTLLAYAHDAETVEGAETHFSALLDSVHSMGFDNVHLVAHSMGTRLVARVLKQKLEAQKPVPDIRELMLAAADINAGNFRAYLAPVLAQKVPPRITLYASSSDVALIASAGLHRLARVGDAKPAVFTYSPFETIDASAAAPVSRAYGHSYVFDSPSVLADMAVLIHQGLGARQRPRLRPVPGAAVPHWTLP